MVVGAFAGLGFVKDVLAAAAPVGTAFKVGRDTVFTSPPAKRAIEEIIESGVAVPPATSIADLWVSESSEVTGLLEGLTSKELIITPDEIDWFLQRMAQIMLEGLRRPAVQQ